MEVKKNGFSSSDEEENGKMDLQTQHIARLVDELIAKEVKINRLECQNLKLEAKLAVETHSRQKFIDLWKEEILARKKAERSLKKLEEDIIQLIEVPFNKIKTLVI